MSQLRFEVALIRPEQVLDALDLASSYSLSQWDALILKAAAASGCRVLLTEDLQHGQTIEGVTVHNPFLAPDPVASRRDEAG